MASYFLGRAYFPEFRHLFPASIRCIRTSRREPAAFRDLIEQRHHAIDLIKTFSLVSVDLSGINGSNINSLEGMFNSCSELVSVALPDLSDSMATSAQAMFFNCAKLADLDLADVRMPLLSNMFGGLQEPDEA